MSGPDRLPRHGAYERCSVACMGRKIARGGIKRCEGISFTSADIRPDYSSLSFLMPSPKKLILVIGATGAQGLAVIDGLLSPRSDGLASPYCVRALTRDPHSRRAQQLTAKGVHCVQGLLC